MLELTFCLRHKEAGAIYLCTNAAGGARKDGSSGEEAVGSHALPSESSSSRSVQAGHHRMDTSVLSHAGKLCHWPSSSDQQTHLHTAGRETGGAARDLLWYLHFPFC